MVRSESDRPRITGGAEHERRTTAFLPMDHRHGGRYQLRRPTSVVFVHQPTRSITLMEGSLEMEPFLREVASKEGPSPASKASIESLPRVQVSDPSLECPVCLAEYGEVEVKEMPCGHRFHSGCIEKWLGIHGSCPVCRYSMPADEKKEKESDERRRGVENSRVLCPGKKGSGYGCGVGFGKWIR
ncbi:E3 ubiquitin-protein ligase MP [Sesamum angolense]|uniref:RING-type E3 ubiquitin transferase n=1 Tax=Sesamum angolense TaxID=2727404 RepID=A0AAE2C5J2_9LAMI|nr:E3 ubiquitin-protein ligase MP [Sesamum angolense]